MKPHHFIIAGLVTIAVTALLGAYVPPQNPEALCALGFVGAITAIAGTAAAIAHYEDDN